MCRLPIHSGIMACASILGWCYLLWFLLGFRFTGAPLPLPLLLLLPFSSSSSSTSPYSIVLHTCANDHI
jgi:hypothetical protein